MGRGSESALLSLVEYRLRGSLVPNPCSVSILTGIPNLPCWLWISLGAHPESIPVSYLTAPPWNCYRWHGWPHGCGKVSACRHVVKFLILWSWFSWHCSWIVSWKRGWRPEPLSWVRRVPSFTVEHGIVLYKFCLISQPHCLIKTSSMHSKHSNIHPKWLQHETNDNSLLLWPLPRWTTGLFQVNVTTDLGDIGLHS